MSYDVLIADRLYSSWSLRGWLLFAGFDIPVNVEFVKLYTDEFAQQVADFGGGALVPAMRTQTDQGTVTVWDSLAMAETLAEEHPEKHLWPQDPVGRALARSMVAEMHSGFSALRNHCQMHLLNRVTGFEPNDAVRKDVARIEALWAKALALSGSDGWLFGEYSVADAFFAPVAGRFHTFGLDISETSRAYVQKHLDHIPFRQWRAMGVAENRVIEVYELGLPTLPWRDDFIDAEKVTNMDPVNATCPFSGKPVQADSLARVNGTVIGFCNPFCRDKVVADPAAWPKAMALL